MSGTTGPEFALRPVRFSRLSRRGVLLGLSGPRLVTASLGALVLVVALSVAGGAGVAWTSPLWASAAALVWVRVDGRAAVEWLPVVRVWLARRAAGQTRFRRRMRPRPAGTLALPGDAAPLRQYHDPVSGAVMVLDPHARTLTAMLEVTHPSFVLLDPAEQQRRVEGWGRVLASACRSSRIARVQVLERTVPDSGTGLAAWWRERGVDDGSWVATTYRQRTRCGRRCGARA